MPGVRPDLYFLPHDDISGSELPEDRTEFTDGFIGTDIRVPVVSRMISGIYDPMLEVSEQIQSLTA